MTGQDIILKARRIADIVNSKFISDEEALDYLNEAYKSYYDKIIGTATDWLLQEYSVPADEIREYTDGNRVYWMIQPPEDMYKLRGLSVRVGGFRRDLRMFPKLEEFTFPECSYRLTTDNKIKIINPSPIDKSSVVIGYYRPPTEIKTTENAASFTSEKTIIFCFDCGDYAVYGEGDGYTVVNAVTVIDKSDFSVKTKKTFGTEEGFYFIGVSENWIYYVSVINKGQFRVMRTSVNNPFEEEELFYGFPETGGYITPYFPNQSKDSVYLLGQLDENSYSILEITESGAKVADTISVDPLPEGLPNKTPANYFAIGTVGESFIAARTFDEATNKQGVMLPLTEEDIKMQFCYLNRIYGADKIISVNEDCTSYTQQNISKRTTPTEIPPGNWEVYTLPAEGNKTVYLKEIAADIAPNGVSLDYLAYYVAICFLDKQGKDASRFQMKLSEIENRLIEELAPDEHRHQSVANNFRRNNSGWGWL